MLTIETTPGDFKLCKCGSGKAYSTCCEPYHLALKLPETAEQLMRSRYTAYALLNKDYLLKTWHESTRPDNLEFENGLSWQKLTICSTKKGRAKEAKGWVSFEAIFQIGFSQEIMKEKSYFVKNRQGWVYVDGKVR